MTARAAPTEVLMSSARTEAYTDGVFAIAATLLVLDLTTHSIGEVSSEAQLWGALAAMWPGFLSFAVSFALLSGLWVVHLRQFRDIERVDAPLLWLNSARLLFIVLIPFTTSLLSDYSDFVAGRMLLPVNFFLAALLGHLSWRWAAARGGHLLRPEGRATIPEQGAGGLAAVICGGLAAALSPLIGSLGFLAYLLNGPLTRLLIKRGHRTGDAASAG